MRRTAVDESLAQHAQLQTGDPVSGHGFAGKRVIGGAGTDTPFEVVGAPYIDDVKLAEELNRAGLPGVGFMPIRFTPTYSVHKASSAAAFTSC